MKAVLIGGTGLVGKEILKACDESGIAMHTISRRSVSLESPNITSTIETDSNKWPEIIKETSKNSDIFFSSFGTTLKAAGSISKFKIIDHGVNYSCALAAKEAGIHTYVLVSSIGADPNSWFPYLRIKGELEQDVIALGFPRTIILRPGLLLGDREKSIGLPASILEKIGKLFYSTPLKSLGYLTYAKDVGAAGVAIAQQPFSQSNDDKVVETYSKSELLKNSC